MADALATHKAIANKVNVEAHIEAHFTATCVNRLRKNVLIIFVKSKSNSLGTNASPSRDKVVVCMARFVPALCLKCANHTCLCNCIDSNLLRTVGKGSQIKPGK